MTLARLLDTTRLGELLPLGIDMAHACLFDPSTQALIPQGVA